MFQDHGVNLGRMIVKGSGYLKFQFSPFKINDGWRIQGMKDDEDDQ